MKKNHIFLFIILAISLAAGLSSCQNTNTHNFEDSTQDIRVDKPGRLGQIIPDIYKNNITDLTLEGDLNGSDIRYIREMAGLDINNNPTKGKLTKLNLSNAHIVAGGDTYTSNFRYILPENFKTSNNKIGDYMFASTKKDTPLLLKQIILPQSIDSVGVSAFLNAKNLVSVHIPDQVSFIGADAFRGCSALIGQYLPANLKEVKANLFTDCNHLVEILLPPKIKHISDWAFRNCKSLNKILLPTQLDSIGKGVFMNCSAITILTLPPTVTKIGERAFDNCKSLQILHLTNPIPTKVNPRGIGDLGNITQTGCILHVPKGSLKAYQEADYWKDFGKKIIEE